MAADSSLINALVIRGKRSLEELNKLKCASDDAYDSIVAGNGGQIVSGSGNGLSFTVANGKLTNSDWFEALELAIKRIEQRTKVGKSQARFN